MGGVSIKDQGLSAACGATGHNSGGLGPGCPVSPNTGPGSVLGLCLLIWACSRVVTSYRALSLERFRWDTNMQSCLTHCIAETSIPKLHQTSAIKAYGIRSCHYNFVALEISIARSTCDAAAVGFRRKASSSDYQPHWVGLVQGRKANIPAAGPRNCRPEMGTNSGELSMVHLPKAIQRSHIDLFVSEGYVQLLFSSRLGLQ